MKNVITLFLFILGMAITSIAKPIDIGSNDEKAFSYAERDTAVSIEAIESVLLADADYVYFIPIGGDIYAIIIKETNKEEDKENNKALVSGFKPRERKKWVTHTVENNKA